LIVHNPRAGARPRGPLVARLADHLAGEGWQAVPAADLAEASLVAEQLRSEGRLRAVVVAGGDGTVAAVANATPVGTPVVVYPLGTENLVARYFGYRRRPRSVAEVLRTGCETPIDAGLASGRLFVLMISAGFDAEVVRRVAHSRIGHIRRWTYAKPLLTAMRTYKYPELRISWTGPSLIGAESEPRELEVASVRWIFGMNLSKYAFGLNFAPAASGTDGLLDVCTFSEGSVFQVFRYTWGVLLRRHLRYRDARMIRCSQIRIEAPDGITVPYQLDGDFGGFLPVEVRILPRRLRFLLPVATAKRIAAAGIIDQPCR
jgi:diacylglycerol kinase family enzyme